MSGYQIRHTRSAITPSNSVFGNCGDVESKDCNLHVEGWQAAASGLRGKAIVRSESEQHRLAAWVAEDGCSKLEDRRYVLRRLPE